MLSSRIKLFPRKKLFSATSDNSLRKVICKDCGCVLETAESTSSIICPECGGKRFNLALFPKADKKQETETRESLFDIPKNEYEMNLKQFSGEVLECDEFEKIFSDKGEEMIERGYARISDNNQVSISPIAYATERLFSKITISVTKTLELDPEIMNHEVCPEEVIEGLEDRGALPEKGIMIIKKAHGIMPNPNTRVFSEEENWLEDSHICDDLRLEYPNNNCFGIEEFIKIIRERYPDAPEDIIDLLAKEGVIKLSGSQVTIQN